jgi:hypothetical protein
MSDNRWIPLRKLDATNYLFKYRGLTSLAPRNLSFAREYGISMPSQPYKQKTRQNILIGST